MAKHKNSPFVGNIAGMDDFQKIMQTAKEAGRPPSEDSTVEDAQVLGEGDADSAATTPANENTQNTETGLVSTTASLPAAQEEPKGKKEVALSVTPTEKVDYAGVFFQALPRARKGKTIVIPDDLHHAMASAHKAAPNNLPFSDYVTNILAHHLQQHGAEIRRLIAESTKRDKDNPYF